MEKTRVGPESTHAVIPILLFNIGIREIVVKPHEFGDPHSLTIVLPPECEGKINLSRELLREMADWFLPLPEGPQSIIVAPGSGYPTPPTVKIRSPQPAEPPAEIGFGERE